VSGSTLAGPSRISPSSIVARRSGSTTPPLREGSGSVTLSGPGGGAQVCNEHLAKTETPWRDVRRGMNPCIYAKAVFGPCF
jgi:hypothetical protein